MLKNKYTLLQKINLAFCVLRSKLIHKDIRIIRYPVDMRGAFNINFGKNLSIGKYCRFDVFENKQIQEKTLVFGENVQLNDFVHIVAMESIKIGNNVLMASHVFISDNSHGSYKGDESDSDPFVPPMKRHYPTAPIIIEDNVWICEGVMVMPGSTIGKGCIIGAHSIVRGNIPDYSIAVGNPIKVIKKYNFESKKWVKV